MNKLIGIALLGMALSLTACGGDSDSSGSDAVIRPTPKPPVVTPLASSNACQTSATTVTVPNNGSCTFSLPNYNSGAISTATCSNGAVSLGGITAGNGINLNGVTISCAK